MLIFDEVIDKGRGQARLLVLTAAHNCIGMGQQKKRLFDDYHLAFCSRERKASRKRPI